MTNLVATIVLSLTTNWTAIQKITPICQAGDECKIEHKELVLSAGVIQTNTSIKIEFEGKVILVPVKEEREKTASQRKEDATFIELHPLFYISTNSTIYWDSTHTLDIKR